MLNHIATLLTIGLFGAGARLVFETFRFGPRGPHREEPYTAKEIAERGRERFAQTDVTYQYYNSQVRNDRYV